MMDVLPIELHLEIISKLKTARDAYNYVIANCIRINIDKLIYDGVLKPEKKSGLYLIARYGGYRHWVDGEVDSYDDGQYYLCTTKYNYSYMRVNGFSCEVYNTKFGLFKNIQDLTTIRCLLNDKEVVFGSTTDCFINLPTHRGRLLYGMKHGMWEMFDGDRKKKTVYYDFNKRHRVDGPAVINHLKKSDKMEWFIHDLRHRDDGPAIEGAKIKKYYYWGREFKSLEEMKSNVKITICPLTGVSVILLNDDKCCFKYKPALSGKAVKNTIQVIESFLEAGEGNGLIIDGRYAIYESE